MACMDHEPRHPARKRLGKLGVDLLPKPGKMRIDCGANEAIRPQQLLSQCGGSRAAAALKKNCVSSRPEVPPGHNRLLLRLLLLPPHDPQFRRNRERVNRDAERELLVIDWELGVEEDDDLQSNPSQQQS